MSNSPMRQFPGLLPSLQFYEFGAAEEVAAQNLATAWFVTYANVKQSGQKTRYPYLFLRPTDEIKERFGIYSNVLCVFHHYPEIDGRLLDLVDSVISQNSNRLNNLCVLLVTNASSVDLSIARLSAEKESRIIIPFRVNELQGGVVGKRELIEQRIEDHVYCRDLFSISSALKTDRYFFGRSADIQSLIGKYLGCENSSVFGLRRIGKTSILWAVFRELKASGSPVLLMDCSDPHFHKAKWNQTLFRIKESLFLVNGLGKQGHDTFHYSEQDASKCFVEDLKLVKKKLNKPVLLIFDEIESLCFDLSSSNHWASGDDFLFFWQTIRSAFQQNPNLFSFILSGVNPKILETPLILDGKDNPLYRYVQPNYLGFFEVGDVTAMVSFIGGYMGLSFEAEVFTYLTDDFGGHPFLIRQACSALSGILIKGNNARPIRVTKQFYRENQPALIEATREYVDLTLRILVDRYNDEYTLLGYLAADDAVTFIEFAKSSPSWIEHLIGYGLITRSGNGYHFRSAVVQKCIKERVGKLKLPGSTEQMWEVLSTERNTFEAQLRELVRSTLKIAFGTSEAKKKILSVFQKTSQSTKGASLAYDAIFQAEMYFSDLKRLIESEWVTFKNVFKQDKTRFSSYMELVNKHRVDAHAREIARDDFDLVVSQLRWLQMCLSENS